MKAPNGLDRLYRRQCSDAAFSERVNGYFRGLGIKPEQFLAYVEGQRAIRFAQGRATKADRKMRAFHQRRALHGTSGDRR